MLIAERFGEDKIHLIRIESGEVFEFNKNSIPFKALKEHGITRKQIIESLKKFKNK